MAEKVDRRVRKTKQQLRHGLTELMKEKSIKDITVKELAEYVDINRGTFYLHYRDVFDMIEQIETELFDDFSTLINRYPTESCGDNPLPVLRDIFQFLSDNADICTALLSTNGDLSFVNKLKGLAENKALNTLMECYKDTDTITYNYCYSFIVSGCIGIIQKWLESGVKESPDELAHLSSEIILNGISILERTNKTE